MHLVNDVPIQKTEDFLEYISNDDLMEEFSELLTSFLNEYFKDSDFNPLTCNLMMFVFPGEHYIEPMIKLIYPDSDKFNNLKLRDDIEEKFKLYLVEKSDTLKEFKVFRSIQKKFRFVIQREFAS